MVLGGELSGYGWLKDRFGVSCGVVPKALEDMQENGDEGAEGKSR